MTRFHALPTAILAEFMLVFRISLTEFSNQLVSSGRAGRWNPHGAFVIYSAENRSLACLETLVHYNANLIKSSFTVIEIEIPRSLSIEKIEENNLPADWRGIFGLTHTQAIGKKWLAESASAVLRIPSVIVPNEFNFLLNPLHPAFKKIKIKNRYKFDFDNRLKK